MVREWNEVCDDAEHCVRVELLVGAHSRKHLQLCTSRYVEISKLMVFLRLLFVEYFERHSHETVLGTKVVIGWPVGVTYLRHYP